MRVSTCFFTGSPDEIERRRHIRQIGQLVEAHLHDHVEELFLDPMWARRFMVDHDSPQMPSASRRSIDIVSPAPGS